MIILSICGTIQQQTIGKEAVFMTTIGVTRKLDNLGRLVIPKETRKMLNIVPGTSLEFFAGDDGSIILRKYTAKCALCGQEGEPEAMRNYKEALLCEACFSDVQA